MYHADTMIAHLWQLTGNTPHQFNQRIGAKEPPVWIYLLLQYMFPCEKLAYAQSLPPKIVHKRAFYMETCAEGGDSAQPRANLSNLQSYTSSFMTAYGLPLNRLSLPHPTFITIYGLHLNRHSLTHPRPS